MSNEAKILMCEYRIQVLSARDPAENMRLINKLKRKIRNLKGCDF